jgi:hypothetical protein
MMSIALRACLIGLLLLAGCNSNREPRYQG